jgi:hypothetical protein
MFVALAPSGLDGSYPGKLNEISERWIGPICAPINGSTGCFYGERSASKWPFSKLIAGIYDVPAELVPILRQDDRRQHGRRRFAVAGLVAVVISVSSFGGWQW